MTTPDIAIAPKLQREQSSVSLSGAAVSDGDTRLWRDSGFSLSTDRLGAASASGKRRRCTGCPFPTLHRLQQGRLRRTPPTEHIDMILI